MASWLLDIVKLIAVLLVTLALAAIPVAVVGGFLWALWTSGAPTPVSICLTGLVVGMALLVLDAAWRS